MKPTFYIITLLLIIIPLTIIGKEKTVYYKKSKKNKWGDYSYSQRISKKKTEGISYFAVSYKRRRILTEKHYDSWNKLIYIAKYSYSRKTGRLKFEVLFNKGIIRIKQRSSYNRSHGRISTSKYSKIKYLTFNGTDKKLLKVEEYHSNGKIRLTNHYADKEILEKQESFDRKGRRLLTKHFRYFGKKKVVWKEERYNKHGGYLGYWEYYFNDYGKRTGKGFHNK